MTLEEAKHYLLRNVMTPAGSMTLYGINILPNLRAMGLIFYTDVNNKCISQMIVQLYQMNYNV